MIREKVGEVLLTNKKYSKNWHKDIDKFYLENSIGWEVSNC